MSKATKYWRGLEELANSPEFTKHQQNEFAEEVPVEQFLGKSSLDSTSTSRRDFLKFLGFSVTAASLAACEAPVNKAIPYIIKPEEITPGVANWYASTYFDGQDYASILVKTREGRPIKIEGNDQSPVTNGGTNARVQASVLSLYDSSRLTGPQIKGAPANWATVDKEVTQKLGEVASLGAEIRILSSSIISPSTKQAITDFSAKYPTAKHVTYDAVSASAIIKANGFSFERPAVPAYYFDKANVIVSIGADFLGNWLMPIEFAKQYAKGRRLRKGKSEMAKHIQFEANLSLTGANADERYPVKPSQFGTVTTQLYNAIALLAGVSALESSKLAINESINKVAKELWANKKKALVVCGVNDVAVQMVVNGINTILDSYENTVDLREPLFVRQGNDEQFSDLLRDMKNGNIAALITYNTNPSYTAPEQMQFNEAYKKVGLRISFADRMDETASLSDYVCPDHHYLESWNDANPKENHFSLTQPTIAPLFSKSTGHEGTRAAQESILKWAGVEEDYHSYIQKYWKSNLFTRQSKETNFQSFWNTSLHNGVFEASITTTETITKKAINTAKANGTENSIAVVTRMDLASAAAVINKFNAKEKEGNFELALYEKVSMGNGTQANNPWLQEMPDPISKVTWDNYVTMSPLDMKGKYRMQERQDREASIVNVTFGNISIPLPVYPQPGQAQGTIGIALGYGRTKAGSLNGKVEGGMVGQNAYPFVQFVNGSLNYNVTGIQLSEEIGTTELAATQVHHTIMGRNLVRETTLEEYKKDAKAGNEEEMLVTHAGKKDPVDVTLWDKHERLGHHWAMLIDLNSCIGCGSCVVSCTAENNVAVVGKDQVRRTREMHWLRIDRYYQSDMTAHKAEEEHVGAIDMYLQMESPSAQNPKVIFQPVMCQHCNNAPCETVCPVLATNHSSEGLNQMTYNRCVGTRYCANNCPFKVRRFNWFNYNENDMFAGLNPAQDDLGRMVLNPDVVVRSRGVMEKCTMCVQRLQTGKLDAKKAMQKLQDGAIKTACQQSCPTEAIVFGDANDANSKVTELRKDERNYYMLHELNISSNVSYMVKVRNTAPTEMHEAKHKGGAEKHEEHHVEEKKES